jgi:hypothetical protein
MRFTGQSYNTVEAFGRGDYYVSTKGQAIKGRCSECDLDVFANREGDAHCCCYDVEADSIEIPTSWNMTVEDLRELRNAAL